MTFRNVLVQVLDCLNTDCNLDVDVTVVFEEKEWAVRYNMTVVIDPRSLQKFLAIVRMLVGWV